MQRLFSYSLAVWKSCRIEFFPPWPRRKVRFTMANRIKDLPRFLWNRHNLAPAASRGRSKNDSLVDYLWKVCTSADIMIAAGRADLYNQHRRADRHAFCKLRRMRHRGVIPVKLRRYCFAGNKSCRKYERNISHKLPAGQDPGAVPWFPNNECILPSCMIHRSLKPRPGKMIAEDTG